MTTLEEMDALARLKRDGIELAEMADGNFTSTGNVDTAETLDVPTDFPNPDRQGGGP